MMWQKRKSKEINIKPLSENKNLTGKKKAAIVGGSVGLAVLVAGASMYMFVSSDDLSNEDSNSPNVNNIQIQEEGDEYYLNNSESPNFYEEDGYIDESRFEGILGVEAGEIVGEPKVLPWYAVSAEDVKIDDEAKSETSTGSNSKNYQNILAKMDLDKKASDAEKNYNGGHPTDEKEKDESVQNIVNSVDNAVRDKIEGALTKPDQVTGGSQGNSNESQSQEDEQLQSDLDKLKEENDSLKEYLESLGGTDGTATEPNTETTEPNTETTTPTPETTTPLPEESDTPTVESKPTTNTDNGLKVVKFNSSDRFSPLDFLDKQYYLELTSDQSLNDYFEELNKKYKGQLLIDSLKYKAVEGSDNTKYLITANYFITKKEMKELNDKAKEFNNMYSSLSDTKYMEKLADHIADLALYGESSNKYSPISLLDKERVVCQAYASYAQLLLSNRGINNYLATGEVDGEDHVWNVVTISGTDYHYDFTMYDTSNRNNKYLKTSKEKLTDRKFQYYIK